MSCRSYKLWIQNLNGMFAFTRMDWGWDDVCVSADGKKMSVKNYYTCYNKKTGKVAATSAPRAAPHRAATAIAAATPPYIYTDRPLFRTNRSKPLIRTDRWPHVSDGRSTSGQTRCGTFSATTRA